MTYATCNFLLSRFSNTWHFVDQVTAKFAALPRAASIPVFQAPFYSA